MERYNMFLDWKSQPCENDYMTQSNRQIQCNPYQTTNGIFQRTTTILKFVWKHKRTQQPKQSWERKTELEKSASLTSECKATVIKTVWYWHKKRPMINGTE